MRFNVRASEPVRDMRARYQHRHRPARGQRSAAGTLGSTCPSCRNSVRQLTLNESFDLQRTARTAARNERTAAGGGYGQPYMNARRKTCCGGAMEIWQIANLTADTHPIHFHLVNVQVISRQASRTYKNGVPNSPARRARRPFERGWKETVRMNPGEVTTVIMQFNLPSVPFTVPPSPRTGGNEYVWHCHILEHEEHDMMRPLIVA
jgi:spore coat protein A